MERTILGRTGLSVSVAGLGCGGHSRLGMTAGLGEKHATRVVEHALDLGINFIDTARAYGTEPAVGAAIRGKRDAVVISTKVGPGRGGELIDAAALRDSLERSLRRLGTDYVDVFHLHGVGADQYPYCVDALLPELERQRTAGTIRFLGITERFGADPSHRALDLALTDDHFDVMMVGFNMLNPSARRTVFPRTLANGVGTLIMFAVRRALSRSTALVDVVARLVDEGAIAADAVDAADPLGFVEADPDVRSIVEAAYRFCRHEPRADVILTGTGSIEHLEENVAAILARPLPAALTDRLTTIFGDVDSVSGN